MRSEVGEDMSSIVAYSFGGGVLDLKARQWIVDGCAQTLQPKVFALLLHLIENRDRAVTHVELRGAVWGETVVCPGAIAQCIWTLRRELGHAKGRSACIVSLKGVGYRFVGCVQEHRVAPLVAAPRAVAGENELDVMLARLWAARCGIDDAESCSETSLIELALACQALADAVLKGRTARQA